MRRFQIYVIGGGTLQRRCARSREFDRVTGIVIVGDSTGRATAINFGFPTNDRQRLAQRLGMERGRRRSDGMEAHERVRRVALLELLSQRLHAEPGSDHHRRELVLG